MPINYCLFKTPAGGSLRWNYKFTSVLVINYFSFSRTNRQRVWEEQIPQPTGSWHYKSRFREPADGLARSRNGSRGSSVRSWAASRRGAACAKWGGRGLWWRALQLHLACSEFTEIVLRWRPSLQTPHPEMGESYEEPSPGWGPGPGWGLRRPWSQGLVWARLPPVTPWRVSA